MTLISARVYIYTCFFAGVLTFLSLCTVIGWGLGYAFGAPITGALCGVAWYVAGFFYTIDEVGDDLDLRVQLLNQLWS